MILVDTSVWIEHFRRGEPALVAELTAGRVIVHPFVLGELAMGGLDPRGDILRDLARLPAAVVARHEEVMALVEAEPLYGLGIGYVDAHLLASARLTADARLWTRDRRLAEVAGRMGLAA